MKDACFDIIQFATYSIAIKIIPNNPKVLICSQAFCDLDEFR